jgi:protein-tyrosine phosphatase
MPVKKKTQPKLMDIHTHILPGADDGAKDMQEALSLVRLAWDNGTTGIVLTPHHRGTFKNDPDSLRERFRLFQKAVHKEVPKMKLWLGCEIRYQSDIPQKIQQGALLTMCDSRYVLLEFASTAFRSHIVSAIRECEDIDKIPIIAHAERYDAFHQDASLVDEVLRMGARIQLNADSIMGKCGFRVKRLCHKLLKAKKVHFVASDAHDSKYRRPVLLPCYNRIRKKYGEEYAKQLFWYNPRTLIEK